jgi:hypothetical protein
MVTCVGSSEDLGGTSVYISLKGLGGPLFGGMGEDIGTLVGRLGSLEGLPRLAKGEVANSRTLLS